MHILSCKSTGVDKGVMTLSLVTVVQDVHVFVRFASAFVETAAICAELVFDSINRQTK
jgi:hypothetical protein